LIRPDFQRFSLARLAAMSIIFLMSVLAEASAQDCVPLTFTTLSRLYSHPISYVSWMNDLMPRGGSSTNLAIALKDWRDREPYLRIVHVYPTLHFNDEFEVGRPYLLACTMPASEVEADETTNGHACVVYFHDDFVILYHTIFDTVGGAEYAMEKWTWDQFYDHALAVYAIEPVAPLKRDWKMIVGVREHQRFLLTGLTSQTR